MQYPAYPYSTISYHATGRLTLFSNHPAIPPLYYILYLYHYHNIIYISKQNSAPSRHPSHTAMHCIISRK